MKRSVKQRITWAIVVPIVTTVIAWLLTREAVSSFLIGLMSEIIVLLIELQLDVENTRNSVIATVSLSEAAAFNESLRRLVSDFDAVMAHGDLPFTTTALETLQATGETMAGLRQGYMRIRGLVPAYVKGTSVLQHLRKGGIATAIISNPDDWSSGEIQFYHQVNMDLARAGKQFTRIFILRSTEFLAEHSPIFATMKEEHDAGINVRYAIFDELGGELVRDVGLWDDKLDVNIEFSAAGIFEAAMYTTSPTTIQETRDYLERVLRWSHPFGDVLTKERS